MNNIVKGSFVVISDFHAIKWPLEKVKDYYLNEYDKIFILGDATDRGEDWQGTGGIELLQEIKELSDKYPNRVVYIPGNHDVSLYDYAKYIQRIYYLDRKTIIIQVKPGFQKMTKSDKTSISNQAFALTRSVQPNDCSHPETIKVKCNKKVIGLKRATQKNYQWK